MKIRPVVDRVQNAVAKVDVENINGSMEKGDVGGAAVRTGTALTLEGVNAFASGTPVGWVTGGVQILRGFGQFFNAMIAGDEAVSGRFMLNGLKNIGLGASAMFPVVGNIANGAFATVDGIHAINEGVRAVRS